MKQLQRNGHRGRDWGTRLFVLQVALALVVGCTAGAVQDAASSTSSPASAPAQQPAAETPSAPTSQPVSGPMVLTLWTPEFMGTNPSQGGGALFERMLTDFVDASAEPLRIETQVKARYGKGGLLDYLKTAQPVAPSVLPDIIAIDAAELEQAVAAGSVRPLDGLIEEDVLAGLYPAARALGRLEGRQYALPYALDIEHVVYDTEATGGAPETWTGLLAGNTQYLFPLSVPAVRTGPAAAVPPVLISHYLGAEYALDSETRRLALNSEPLLRMLSFYDQAEAEGKLVERPEELTGLQAMRQYYDSSANAIIQSSARQYVAEWGQNLNLAIAPAPGWASPSPPIATGWVLAVVTPDPERQKRAADLLAWLLAPERNGRWTAAAGWLPVSSTGWNYWEERPYIEFLDEQLTLAAPLPVGTDSATAALALQQAAISVVRDGVPPIDAARQALDSTQ